MCACEWRCRPSNQPAAAGGGSDRCGGHASAVPVFAVTMFVKRENNKPTLLQQLTTDWPSRLAFCVSTTRLWYFLNKHVSHDINKLSNVFILETEEYPERVLHLEVCWEIGGGGRIESIDVEVGGGGGITRGRGVERVSLSQLATSTFSLLGYCQHRSTSDPFIRWLPDLWNLFHPRVCPIP